MEIEIPMFISQNIKDFGISDKLFTTCINLCQDVLHSWKLKSEKRLRAINRQKTEELMLGRNILVCLFPTVNLCSPRLKWEYQ